jgi:hypothetical protein
MHDNPRHVGGSSPIGFLGRSETQHGLWKIFRTDLAIGKDKGITPPNYFGGFGRLFESVTDPRHPLYITYPLAALAAAGVC